MLSISLFILSFYFIYSFIYSGPWCPTAKAVANIPNTKNGCALAWYLTSFATGSGKKNLNWKNTCGAIRPKRTSAYVVSPM